MCLHLAFWHGLCPHLSLLVCHIISSSSSSSSVASKEEIHPRQMSVKTELEANRVDFSRELKHILLPLRLKLSIVHVQL